MGDSHVWPKELPKLTRRLDLAIDEEQLLILEKLEKVRYYIELKQEMLAALQRSVDLKNEYENIKNQMLPKMDPCQGVPGKPRKVVRASDVSLIRKFREWKGVTIEVN